MYPTIDTLNDPLSSYCIYFSSYKEHVVLNVNTQIFVNNASGSHLSFVVEIIKEKRNMKRVICQH